ncbi:MAG: DUF4886 domain-containing protein [Alistipes sp.]|nr:DUF4886 domain-containing protein [Alistipes sp.]
MKRFFALVSALFFAVITLSAQEPLRILAIGNSFSEDTFENHIHELATADGRQVVVANLYIGGCTMERHRKNATLNRPKYSYRKTDIDGEKTKTKYIYTIEKALADEKWDYVTIQEQSALAGRYISYMKAAPQLLTYLRDRLPETTKIYIVQTWAYQKNSENPQFAFYNYNQNLMFKSIVSAVKRAGKELPVDGIIPVGVAIQNARGTSLGDTLTRDGYHLDKRIGRYIAASTVYEKLGGKSVLGNTYCPKSVSADELLLAQKSVHAAILKPTKLSKIK